MIRVAGHGFTNDNAVRCAVYVGSVGFVEIGAGTVGESGGRPIPGGYSSFVVVGRLPENITPGRHVIRCEDGAHSVKEVFVVGPTNEQIVEEIETQVNDRINQQAEVKDTNKVGQAIGTGDNKAFFVSAGTVTPIPTLGGPINFASGINAANPAQVVGDSTETSGPEHAFLWSPGGPPVDLGTPSGAPGTSSAAAINALGQVAGAFQPESSGAFHAYLWNPEAANGDAGLWFDLGTLGGGASRALGINDKGQVAGWAELASGASHAFLWTPAARNGTAGQMKDLGTLGGDSLAMAVNSSGQVAGYSFKSADTAHPFLYSGGSLKDIGTLGGKMAGANDINDLGQVVGSSLLADNTTRHAFLYSQGKMFDLQKTIPASSGWQLQSARGINDAGQITGIGLHNGKLEAFMLEPRTVLGPLVRRVGLSGGAAAAARSAFASAISPTSVSVVLGGTVQWQNAGPGAYAITDSSGLGAFGSASLMPGAGYGLTIQPAGTFRYTVSGLGASGRVSVPIEAAPMKGRVKTVFQIYWCFCHASRGFVFDVQIKRPGAKSFRNWITGTTKGESAAKPGHGAGTYSFRARVRKKTGGKHSGWSPPLAVKVK